jgi:Zn finger protein HypA/HybF involved in hydrogenase expression
MYDLITKQDGQELDISAVSDNVRCANCENIHKRTERKRDQIIGVGNNTLDTFNCPKCGSGVIYDLLHYR